MTVRIFYRNQPGYDERVMGWSTSLSDIFRGVPLTDPVNQNVSYSDMEIPEGDMSYQSVNSHGIPTKKVVGGVLEDRLQSDIDKDWSNKDRLIDEAEEVIQGYLQGKLKVTWLMSASDNLFVYLKGLQEAIPISDGALSAEAQTAKATLQYIKDNIGNPVQQAMDDRDASISALDPEV